MSVRKVKAGHGGKRDKSRCQPQQWKKQHLTRLAVLFMGIAVISCFLLFPQEQASAYDAVTELEVTVGYYGLKDYTKKISSLEELERELGTHQEIYTWISNGNTAGTTEAEGIYISDIMAYAGVDMNSVYTYNFFTMDSSTYQQSTQQWTNDQLFCTRYTYRAAFERALEDYNNTEDKEDYLRNPESHFTIDDIFDYSNTNAYTDAAWSSREEVKPMLALRMNAQRWKGYAPASRLDFSNLQENGKPILLFGQAGRNDITRNSMAQMIYKVHVWFEGTPAITVNVQSLDGEVGTKGRLNVTVETPDETLSQAILDDLTYETSDETVAKVGSDGTVEITGAGNANITVSYQGQVYGSVSASGSTTEKEAEETDKKNADQGGDDTTKPDDNAGSGSSSDKGGNSGAGDNSAAGTDGSDSSSDKGKNSSGSDSDHQNKTTGQSDPANRVVQNTGRSGVRIGSRANQPAAGVKANAAGTAGQSTAAAGTDSGQSNAADDAQPNVFEITPAEVNTILQESVIDSGLLRRVLLAGLIVMILGAAFVGWQFRNQTTWEKRAKRIYETNDRRN